MSVSCVQGPVCESCFMASVHSLTHLKLTGLLYDDLQPAVFSKNGFAHLRDPPSLFLLRGGVACPEKQTFCYHVYNLLFHLHNIHTHPQPRVQAHT